MIRILLIRHGSTDLLGRVLYGRMPGVHLSAEGFGEAEILGQALKQQYKLDEVVSSPMERTIETARLIAGPQGLDITIDEGINEIDYGAWRGKAFSEIRESQEWKQYNEFRSTCSPPGGELLMHVQARAWGALERIVARYERHTEPTIAVVSHGDVVRGLLLLLLGMPLDHIHRLEVAPASVSEVLLGAGQPKIRTINQSYGVDSFSSVSTSQGNRSYPNPQSPQ